MADFLSPPPPPPPSLAARNGEVKKNGEANKKGPGEGFQGSRDASAERGGVPPPFPLPASKVHGYCRRAFPPYLLPPPVSCFTQVQVSGLFIGSPRRPRIGGQKWSDWNRTVIVITFCFYHFLIGSLCEELLALVYIGPIFRVFKKLLLNEKDSQKRGNLEEWSPWRSCTTAWTVQERPPPINTGWGGGGGCRSSLSHHTRIEDLLHHHQQGQDGVSYCGSCQAKTVRRCLYRI